ncbi:FitA-like ribbon-helix-helix domain-containing protein [Achromobacter kerstersii]|uniref:FitA-like ribbon-helix-helix domain-containing protein n=1 Tax=Achromobacter kerstersii TaxID=1353890 RepID=UPI003209A0C1
MPTLTIRNLSEDVLRALRIRAEQHGRTIEAEVRAILKEATRSEKRIKLGSLLARIGRQVNLTDEEALLFSQRHPYR